MGLLHTRLMPENNPQDDIQPATQCFVCNSLFEDEDATQACIACEKQVCDDCINDLNLCTKCSPANSQSRRDREDEPTPSEMDDVLF